jgi:AP-2 complex subunit alpha
MIRLTIRATDDAVAPVLIKMMQDKIAAGASTYASTPDTEQPSQEQISDAFANVMVL